MSKSKVKIFGASGCGNVGDDLIALILQKYLQSSLGEVAEVSLIPQQDQHEELKDTDILVIGGGGLIYDYDINNVRNYCDAVNYAFSYRVPVYFMGMGVQHVFSDEAKALYHEALPKVSAIATRGTFDSKFIIDGLSYPAGRVITSRDLVFLYDDILSPINEKPEAKGKPTLALSLADWQLGDNYKQIKPGLEEDYKRYREYLEKHLPPLKEKFDVRIVCQANEDVKVSQYLADMFGVEVTTFPTLESSANLVETYRQADYVITNRYHGLIAAVIAGTPALGVSFSTHKSQRLIDDSFPSLSRQFYTVGDFVEQDVLTKMIDDSFLSTLKNAEPDEYRRCVQSARQHSEIVKYIAADLAKQ